MEEAVTDQIIKTAQLQIGQEMFQLEQDLENAQDQYGQSLVDKDIVNIISAPIDQAVRGS